MKRKKKKKKRSNENKLPKTKGKTSNVKSDFRKKSAKQQHTAKIVNSSDVKIGCVRACVCDETSGKVQTTAKEIELKRKKKTVRRSTPNWLKKMIFVWWWWQIINAEPCAVSVCACVCVRNTSCCFFFCLLIDLCCLTDWMLVRTCEMIMHWILSKFQNNPPSNHHAKYHNRTKINQQQNSNNIINNGNRYGCEYQLSILVPPAKRTREKIAEKSKLNCKLFSGN